MTSAAQSTSLAANVTVVTASGATIHTTEGYYCADASGTLTPLTVAGRLNPWTLSATSSQIPDVSSTDCTVVDPNNTGNPGDYIAVTVTYTYTPLFRAVTAASLLGGAVTRKPPGSGWA